MPQCAMPVASTPHFGPRETSPQSTRFGGAGRDEERRERERAPMGRGRDVVADDPCNRFLASQLCQCKLPGMNRIVVFFGLASVTALLGTVAACSSTTTTETVVDSGTPTSEAGPGAKDAGKDTSTPADEDSGKTTGNPDDACKAEATKNACGECCVKNHPAGYKVVEDSVIACGCKGTGADGGAPACATECATTACATPPKPLDQACNTCLQASADNGACTNALTTACRASEECAKFAKCSQPCNGKP